MQISTDVDQIVAIYLILMYIEMYQIASIILIDQSHADASLRLDAKNETCFDAKILHLFTL